MILNKTEQAQHELKTRQGGLSAVERQLLILCNGKRPASQLADLLGPQATDLAQGLIRRGYLQEARNAARPSVSSPHPGAEILVEKSMRPQVASTAPAARRSLAMARMYLFDMLERALGHHSDIARRHLRAASTPEQLCTAIEECVQVLVELAEPRVAFNVGQQLAGLLPTEHGLLIDRIAALTKASGSST